MTIFPLAPDQTIAQMWSNGARGGGEWTDRSGLQWCGWIPRLWSLIETGGSVECTDVNLSLQHENKSYAANKINRFLKTCHTVVCWW